MNKESSLAHENTKVDEDAPTQPDSEERADTEMAASEESTEPVIEAIVAEATVVEIRTID